MQTLNEIMQLSQTLAILSRTMRDEVVINGKSAEDIAHLRNEFDATTNRIVALLPIVAAVMITIPSKESIIAAEAFIRDEADTSSVDGFLVALAGGDDEESYEAIAEFQKRYPDISYQHLRDIYAAMYFPSIQGTVANPANILPLEKIEELVPEEDVYRLRSISAGINRSSADEDAWIRKLTEIENDPWIENGNWKECWLPNDPGSWYYEGKTGKSPEIKYCMDICLDCEKPVTLCSHKDNLSHFNCPIIWTPKEERIAA